MAVETQGLSLLEATTNLYIRKDAYISGTVYANNLLFFKATAGEIISEKNTVFFGNDGKIYKTNPITLSSSIFVGFSSMNAQLNSEVYVQSVVGQIIRTFENLSIGSRYFLSEIPGEITDSPGRQKNTIIYQIGIAKSQSELLIAPQLIIIN